MSSRRWVVLLGVLVVLVLSIGGSAVASVDASSVATRTVSPPLGRKPFAMDVPTPGPGAMTIFTVTNPATTTLSIENVFTNTSGFTYSFWDQIPPASTTTYHVSTLNQLPSPFSGSVSVYASQPFAAQIVGYDYPSSSTVPNSPTPTPSGTVVTAATNTPSTIPPATNTPSTTPSATNTPSTTPSATNTPSTTVSATPTSPVGAIALSAIKTTAVIDNATISVVLSNQQIVPNPIQQIAISTMVVSAKNVPDPTIYQEAVAFEVHAIDSTGQVVRILNAPAAITINFAPTSPLNFSLAQIESVDGGGNGLMLAAPGMSSGTPNYTMSYTTTNFTSFFIYAPKNGVLVPLIYVVVAAK